MTQEDHLIVTITGPSGSGKTVLSKILKERGFEPLISTTTRAAREGEKSGEDYYFLTQEQFHRDLEMGLFMENVSYNGTLYGVSAKEAARAFAMNKPAVLVAEPHGVEQISEFCKEKGWRCFKVFVDNDVSLLLGRLLNRLRTDLTAVEYNDSKYAELLPWTLKLQEALSLEQTTEKDYENILREMVDCFGLPIHPEKIGAAAKRLSSFDFEQKNWVLPAKEKGGYDLITPSFNKESQDDVVQMIIEKTASSAFHSTQKFKI